MHLSITSVREANERTMAVLHDAEKLLELCKGDFDDTSECQLLIRLLKEQTIFNDNGTRRLREKKEKEKPSKVLLNPSDPEATFRKKAGGKHLGYAANLTETVAEIKVWSWTMRMNKTSIPTASFSKSETA